MQIVSTILSVGQIVGLLLILDFKFIRRSSRYKGLVLVFAGLCPLIKLLTTNNVDKLSIVAGMTGILFLFLGCMYFNHERSK
jgi:hypothetical protein